MVDVADAGKRASEEKHGSKATSVSIFNLGRVDGTFGIVQGKRDTEQQEIIFIY